MKKENVRAGAIFNMKTGAYLPIMLYGDVQVYTCAGATHIGCFRAGVKQGPKHFRPVQN